MARRVVWALLLVLAVAAVEAEVNRRYCFCHDQGDNYNGTYQTCIIREGATGGLTCNTEAVSFITPFDRYGHGVRGIVRPHGITRRFYYAEVVCDQDGGRLAVPHSKEGYKVLSDVVNSWNWRSAYIGISDRKTEGNFVDPDGAPLPLIPWMKKKSDKFDKDCVEILRKPEVNDIYCYDEGNPFICERRMRLEVPKGHYYLDWVARRLYQLYNTKSSHAAARRHCEKVGGTLAAPETWDAADSLIITWIRKERFWVDFTDEDVEGQFVTSKGKLMEDLDYRNWFYKEPDNGGKSGKADNCVAMTTGGQYEDRQCGEKLNYICEIKVF